MSTGLPVSYECPSHTGCPIHTGDVTRMSHSMWTPLYIPSLLSNSQNKHVLILLFLRARFMFSLVRWQNACVCCSKSWLYRLFCALQHHIRLFTALKFVVYPILFTTDSDRICSLSCWSTPIRRWTTTITNRDKIDIVKWATIQQCRACKQQTSRTTNTR